MSSTAGDEGQGGRFGAKEVRILELPLAPIVYRLSPNSHELELARNLKLGPMIGNDVHQFLLKYEPSQPHGGAVTKA